MESKEEKFYAIEAEDVLKKFNSGIDGLNEEEAKKIRARHGYNELPDKSQRSALFTFFKQFNSLIVYILIVSAIISFFLQRIVDGYVILLVVMINVILGFVQEYKAETTIKSLKKMIIQQAKVYRDGELVLVPSNKLVPGDVIYVE
ncbi:MAG: cation-transporting P-type ATPase, partial [Nanoarchaeota archaeon]